MNKFNLTTDYIYNDKVNKDITIIHFADIHFSITSKLSRLLKLVDYVKKIKPDYIMITGDTIDNPSIIKKDKIKELIIFLTRLGEVSPVFISLGNHDIISNEDYLFFESLNSIKNINILNNKSYQDKNICVIGMTLPSNYYYNISRKESSAVLVHFINNEFKELHHTNKVVPIILLVHSPICLNNQEVLKAMQNADIVLSGHTHRGMVPKCLDILFKDNRGIIAPNKEFFPKVAKGKMEYDINGKKITIIINGAITKLSRQAGRLFNSLNVFWPSDINKIIITRKKEENE